MYVHLELIVVISIMFNSNFIWCIQSSKLIPEKKQQTSTYINFYDDQKPNRTNYKITFPNNKESPIQEQDFNKIYKANQYLYHSVINSLQHKNQHFNKESVNGLNPNNLNILETTEKKIIDTVSNSRANVIDALDDISRYDNLQCVAKLVCDFVSEQKSKLPFPNILLTPELKNIIYELPQSSPALLYGKAALIGISDDDIECNTEYPQCPGNKDDLLYYLNNYRGGLFKFFNGGNNVDNTNGEESNVKNYDIKMDPTNVKNFISNLLSEYMLGFLSPTEQQDTRKQNLGLPANTMKKHLLQYNYNHVRKIPETGTRLGKIVNKMNNNYYGTQTASHGSKPYYASHHYNQPISKPYYASQHYNEPVAKPYYPSQHYKKPILDRQLTTTTANPNIYVTNSKGEIEYYINRQGQKIYV